MYFGGKPIIVFAYEKSDGQVHFIAEPPTVR